METQSFTRTEAFDCDSPPELDIRIRGGRIEVRAADVPQVRVEISAEPGDTHAVRETQVAFSEHRRKLVVRAPRSFRRAGIDVVVEAPRYSKLKAHAHRGAISASGALSELVAATGSGPVTAEEIEGSVDVATGSGMVKLGRVSGRLRARLGSGELELVSVEGEGASIATGHGDVWLGVVRCDANVRTGHGAIVVAEHASGDLSLATGSGDLRVGVSPGVAAELDLVSGSGRARSELDVTDQPPAGAPVASIRMRTGSGEAVVASAAV
jgi:DUF4097 and DUF4098 domain-containing protein YvlB